MAASAPARFGPGDCFGPYTIVQFLRRGGMAEVYSAKHNKLDKAVAIKVLRDQAIENDGLRERFVREGTQAAMVRHPNVVDVTDVGDVGGVPFLVMELLVGETLGDRLRDGEKMAIVAALELFFPLCAGVLAGHRAGVVHRDLKPDNIFLAQAGGERVVPKVLDFGISRLIDGEDIGLTLPDTVLGTPAYLSPEQARGEVTGIGTDQYSLAAVLYRVVTGALPRQGETVLAQLTSAARGEVTPPREYMPEIPPVFERALLRAMDLEPARRFATLAHFARALLPLASVGAREFWRAEFLELRPDDEVPESVASFDDEVAVGAESDAGIPQVRRGVDHDPAPDTSAFRLDDDHDRPSAETRVVPSSRGFEAEGSLPSLAPDLGELDTMPGEVTETTMVDQTGKSRPRSRSRFVYLLAMAALLAAGIWRFTRPPAEPAATVPIEDGAPPKQDEFTVHVE
ncbi:MAG: serine/threonine-protein kinase, partial [Myxococcota bacterium]